MSRTSQGKLAKSNSGGISSSGSAAVIAGAPSDASDASSAAISLPASGSGASTTSSSGCGSGSGSSSGILIAAGGASVSIGTRLETNARSFSTIEPEDTSSSLSACALSASIFRLISCSFSFVAFSSDSSLARCSSSAFRARCSFRRCTSSSASLRASLEPSRPSPVGLERSALASGRVGVSAESFEAVRSASVGFVFPVFFFFSFCFFLFCCSDILLRLASRSGVAG